jgi:hypothetical protein
MVGDAVDRRRWRPGQQRIRKEAREEEGYVHAHDGLLLWGFVAHGDGG